MTWIVHTGDAVEIMRTLPSASVDCVVTDPPYGDTSLSWDSKVDGWLPEAKRLLRPSGSLWFFTSMRHLLHLAAALDGWSYAQDIVWEKQNGSSSMADRFRRVHEHAVQIYPAGRPWSEIYHEPQFTMDAKAKSVRRKNKPSHWGGIANAIYTSTAGGPRLARSVMQVKSCHGHAIHPTQKPEGIVKPLVLYSCPKGGVVLDPFAGSGTTGAVCINNQRNFIGIELSPEYAALARNRIAASDPIGEQQRILA